MHKLPAFKHFTIIYCLTNSNYGQSGGTKRSSRQERSRSFPNRLEHSLQEYRWKKFDFSESKENANHTSRTSIESELPMSSFEVE